MLRILAVIVGLLLCGFGISDVEVPVYIKSLSVVAGALIGVMGCFDFMRA